jgi:L-rhamnose isomerase
METKQSSIDFLLTELDIPKLISRENLIMVGEVVRQAKEMHKQEIVDAYRFGISDEYVIGSEEYYNETFGGNNEQ